MAGAWGSAAPRSRTQLPSSSPLAPEAEPPGRTSALAPRAAARPFARQGPRSPRVRRAPLPVTARLPLPALRATGASQGAPLLGRARGRGTVSGRCPCGHGQLACAPSRSWSGPPPRPGGRRQRWLPLGLLPRPRRGAGVGREMGGEAGASWRGEHSHGWSGGAVPPAAGDSDPAAGAP